MNLQQVLTDRNIDAQSIPIFKTTGESSFPDMYSIYVVAPPGSAVLITAQVEVTNPYDYNVGCGFRIIRDNITVLPAAMMNITPAEHHTVRNFVVWDLPTGNTTYRLDGYAAASKVQSGHALKVEEGCGLMQVAVFAPDVLA
jgi:hypothetical protein